MHALPFFLNLENKLVKEKKLPISLAFFSTFKFNASRKKKMQESLNNKKI